MKIKRIKNSIRAVLLLLSISVFFLNVNLKIGDYTVLENTFEAKAFMFGGTASCFGGTLGSLWSLPICNDGCPYEIFHTYNNIGTCTIDPDN